MLLQTSTDEPVTYSYVVRMLTPAESPKELFERWVIYGDYHYGYPFYFFSALAVLPVRWVYGELFTDHTALNLLLLRQWVSVLPMLAACVLMVFLFTRFRSTWQTFALLLVMLSVRGIVRNHIQWWHPDALSVLAVVLTIFFLERDRLRFGKNFYLAAAACGVAAGIKLAGFFFVLAVGGCLVGGMRGGTLTLKRAVLAGVLFIVVMLAALVVTNPVLYNAGARQEIARIQLFKTEELDQGYAHDDPLYDSKGPIWWEATLSDWYANPWMLAFAVSSLLAGCIWGSERLLNRIILGWCLPYSVYLLWFVAVKPDHYWLPVMVPFFGAIFNLPILLMEGSLPDWARSPRVKTMALVVVLLLLAGFVAANVIHPGSGIVDQFSAALNIENNL